MSAQKPEFGIELVPEIDFIHNNWGRALGVAVVASFAKVPGLINPDLDVRNILPEPFDIPDHVGNIGGMAVFVLPVMRGWLRAHNEKATTAEWFKQDLRRTAKFIGGVTIAANLAGELIGYGPTSTPDPIDFVYGLAGGYAFYRAMKPEFMPESDVDEVLDRVAELDKLNALTPQTHEVSTRFSGYKQKINDLRAKLAPKQRGKTSKSNRPNRNKRYTPRKR